MRKIIILVGLVCTAHFAIAQDAVIATQGETATRTPKTQDKAGDTETLQGNPARMKEAAEQNRLEAIRQREEAARRAGAAVNPSLAEQERFLRMPRTEIAQLPIAEQVEAMRALGQQAMSLNAESLNRAREVLSALGTQLDAELRGTAPNSDRVTQLKDKVNKISTLVESLEAEQLKLIRLINGKQ